MPDPLTPAEYRAFVASMLTYPGAFSYERCAIGAATEAAEALAYVAKCRWQGHSFDRETLALELGDVLFYLVGIDAVNESTFGGENLVWPSADNPVDQSDQHAVIRELMRCAYFALEGAAFPSDSYGAMTKGAPELGFAVHALNDVASGFGYSLADLAALNVAKLRARYAATGGQFDAATSAGRKGDGE